MDLHMIRNRTEELVDYICEEIRFICTRIPKRTPGSEGERMACDHMAEILRKDCGCTVTVESFAVHPGAFYGWLCITNPLFLGSIAALFFMPVLSAAMIILGFLIDAAEFILYKQAIDPLFPKTESCNVTAVQPAAGEVKQRIFLNGHLDAAWEWPLNYYFGGVVFEICALIPTIGALYYLVLAVMLIVSNGFGMHFLSAGGVRTAALAGFVFIPFMFGICFVRNRKRVVDGANDNLTGCYMGIAILKALREAGIQPEHTELGVLLTGSEESGLRGAKAWCKAHAEEYRDVPTYVFSFDTIHDPQFLAVNLRDLNGTLAMDEDLAEAFCRAAEETGVSCGRSMVPIMGGGTDAAAFRQAGMRAIGITALNHKLESYYHTRRDSWDNLDKRGIAACLQATLQLIENYENS